MLPQIFMDKYNEKKKQQLGMAAGTAQARLRKSLFFNMLVELKKNICFQCSFPITEEADLSIEHKVPWLDSGEPNKLFFDLDNIAFSHLKCNVGAGRKYHQKYFTKEARRKASTELSNKWKQKNYSKEKRHIQYVLHGH